MKTIKEIEQLLNQEDLDKYEDIIDSYMNKLNKDGNKVSLKQLAAALLISGNKEKKDETKIKFVSHSDRTYQRFFITLGKKDNVSTMELIEFLKSKVDGLSLDDFRDVYMLDAYSFFEVDERFKDTIIERIENALYNERNVHIEFSEMRKPGNKHGNFLKHGEKKFYR